MKIKYEFLEFLGHLNHSGELFLWMSVIRSASSVVHRATCVNIFSSRSTGPILTKIGMLHLWGKETRNCKFQDPVCQDEVILGKRGKTDVFL